jgi:hypothetical protein
MLYTLRPRLGSHHCPRGQLGPAETWGRGGGIPGGVQTESGGAVQLAPPCPYGDVNGRRGATRGNSLPSRRLRLRARAAEGPRRSGGRSPVRGPFRPGGSTAGEDRTARTLLARVPGARALRISTAAPLPSSREGRERSAGSWSAGSWTTDAGSGARAGRLPAHPAPGHRSRRGVRNETAAPHLEERVIDRPRTPVSTCRPTGPNRHPGIIPPTVPGRPAHPSRAIPHPKAEGRGANPTAFAMLLCG